MTIQGQSRGRQGQWVHYYNFRLFINSEPEVVSLREIVFGVNSHFYLIAIL